MPNPRYKESVTYKNRAWLDMSRYTATRKPQRAVCGHLATLIHKDTGKCMGCMINEMREKKKRTVR